MSDTETGCIVPVLQSAVVGLLAGLVALAVVMLQGWSAWYALGAGALSALLTFISGVSAWRRSQFDDIYYSPPPPPALPQAQSVKVELRQPLDGGQQTQLIDLPTDSERLAALARGLLAGQSFSESAWTGGRGLFTRSEFSQLRNEMIKRGLAAWNNSHTTARGVTLTPAGRGVMRRFASESARLSPYPLPRDGDIPYTRAR